MKLNLCCGPNMFPGWINIDRADMETAYLRHLRDAPDGFVWPEPQRELAAWVKQGKPLHFEQYDVRRGLLQWEDATVDAIYIGQAIEHFNRRTEAPALLRECLRVLRPGGVMRLTTPSAEWIARAYIGGRFGMQQWAAEQPAFYATALPEDQFAYLLFGASGDGCTAENYEGHFHAYTPRSLGALLEECGFRVHARSLAEFRQGFVNQFRQGFVNHFADASDCGMSHSFAIEAVKP